VPPIKDEFTSQNNPKPSDSSSSSASFPAPTLSAEAKKIQAMNQQYMQAGRRKASNTRTINKIRNCVELGSDPETLMLIERVLKEKPDHYEALMTKANILWKQGELNAALDCLNHFIGYYPDQYKAYFHKGVIFLQQHRHLEAVENFNMGFVRLRPEYGSSSLESFMFLNCKVSFKAVKETALSYIEQSLQLYPAYRGDLLMLRALFYAAQDDFISACFDIEFACRNPRNQLATTLKTLIWKKAARVPSIPNPQTTPLLQGGRIPIAFLLNLEMPKKESQETL
jgi:tetratricopeptide (TPR) repeat protein